MTLATVFFICIFSAASAPVEMSASRVQFEVPRDGQQESPSEPADSSAAASPAKTSASQPQSPSASPAPASAAPQSSSGQNQPVPAKRRWRKGKKKAPAVADCNTPPAATGEAGSTPTSNPGSSTANPSGTTAGSSAKAPGNCPPPKIVVIHDGGTTEPAIQLTGGTGGGEQQSKERSTDQLLASTEDNLKKIAGRQLTSAQQEMLTQIHQFMDQSKAAVAAKDVDRGHNLALKANLLSDELTKP